MPNLRGKKATATTITKTTEYDISQVSPESIPALVALRQGWGTSTVVSWWRSTTSMRWASSPLLWLLFPAVVAAEEVLGRGAVTK